MIDEAPDARAAYQASIAEFFGPDDKPTGSVESDESWINTEVYAGGLEEASESDAEPVFEVEGN